MDLLLYGEAGERALKESVTTSEVRGEHLLGVNQ